MTDQPKPSDSYRVVELVQICGTCRHCTKVTRAGFLAGYFQLFGSVYICTLEGKMNSEEVIDGMKLNGTCDMWEGEE